MYVSNKSYTILLKKKKNIIITTIMLIYDKRMRSEADYLVALSQLCSFLFWYTAIHPPDDFV
jgi:hypothetical protein